MIEVRLYGALRRRFGKSFSIHAVTPAKALQHLSSVLDGFADFLLEHSAPGYHVYVDKVNISADELSFVYPDSVVRVIPIVAGSGGDDGFFKAILGAALIVASMYVPGLAPWAAKAMAGIGVSLAMGGVAQMLAPSPRQVLPSGQRNADDPGHSFSGQANLAAQDQVIPVLYGGPLEVGSLTISLGTSADTSFGTGKGAGPFRSNAGDDAWEQMSSANNSSAWFNGGDGDVHPFIWNVDAK